MYFTDYQALSEILAPKLPEFGGIVKCTADEYGMNRALMPRETCVNLLFTRT
jgi:hypothetical protein